MFTLSGEQSSVDAAAPPRIKHTQLASAPLIATQLPDGGDATERQAALQIKTGSAQRHLPRSSLSQLALARGITEAPSASHVPPFGDTPLPCAV